MPVERAAARLQRILVMVPWIIRNPDASVADICDRFGISREDLTADIDLLMVCGLPPFGPGDLIFAEIDGERVTISMADYLAHPPRLTEPEAIRLLVMGRAVASLPGLGTVEALESGLAKLDGVVQGAERARAVAARIDIEVSADGADDVLDVVRDAIQGQERLHIEYYSHGRGEMTEREIDPWVAFYANGYWYVAAMDHASDEERTFRVDRIKSATRTGITFERPTDIDPSRYSGGPTVIPERGDERIVIEVSPRARWFVEAVPTDRVGPGRGDHQRVDIRTGQREWLIALLLSAGGDARVLQPPEVAHAVQDAARAALALYETA